MMPYLRMEWAEYSMPKEFGKDRWATRSQMDMVDSFLAQTCGMWAASRTLSCMEEDSCSRMVKRLQVLGSLDDSLLARVDPASIMIVQLLLLQLR